MWIELNRSHFCLEKHGGGVIHVSYYCDLEMDTK